MPWHIEEENQKCQGFAVVKDDDGELEGCHRSRAQAERQLAALYASEEDNDDTEEDAIEDDDLSLQNERAGEALHPNKIIAEQILAKLRTR